MNQYNRPVPILEISDEGDLVQPVVVYPNPILTAESQTTTVVANSEIGYNTGITGGIKSNPVQITEPVLETTEIIENNTSLPASETQSSTSQMSANTSDSNNTKNSSSVSNKLKEFTEKVKKHKAETAIAIIALTTVGYLIISNKKQ